MPLNKYEQRWVPEVQSALGEPILRCVAMNSAGVHALMWTDSLLPGASRQYLFVNGRPYHKVPRTMYLILTPTRVLITGTRTTSFHGHAPRLDAPILTLLRGDAEITSAQGPDGAWAFRFRSRASTAEVELELLPFFGIASELAMQLREFSVEPEMAATTPGVATEAPRIETATAGTPLAAQTSGATPEISPSRRRVLKAYGRSTMWAAIGGLLLIVFCLGGGAREFYKYSAGTPTTATVVSCHGTRYPHCEGKWNVDGASYTGRMPSTLLNRYEVGSTHDIRVTDGRAYSVASVQAWLLRAGFIIVLVVVMICVRAFIRRWFFLGQRR
jgi:hypothetical protein